MDSNFVKKSQNLSDLSEKDLYKLSNDQEIVIKNSRIEIKNGNFQKNEDVILEMRKWLKNNLPSADKI